MAKQAHWLTHVVSAAGLDDGLELDEALPITDAWALVCQTCGLTDDSLARLVARHHKVPLANFGEADADMLPLFSEEVARQYLVYPLCRAEGCLVVATPDPRNLEAEQVIWFQTGCSPRFQIAPPDVVTRLIDAAYARAPKVEAVNRQLLDEVEIGDAPQVELLSGQGQESWGTFGEIDIDDAPVVSLTNLILTGAISDGASDIHVEPERDHGNVRFRIDGVLRHRLRLPLHLHNAVVSRVKVMGEMDIAVHMRPQDGRASIRVSGHDYDLRISTVPTSGTEKLVIRLLDPGRTPGLEDLGMAGPELERFRKLLFFRDGIVIVTGPTGCGKTTTLYAALCGLATGEENIMTVEDPIEYELAGITQIQVEPRQGVLFANTLRHILRQDPDVILVGEIRDLETAELAVQAAMTGHLVLTTLHTNDAVGSISRLDDLGLSRHLVAETFRGALAQRLLRKVCPHCASTEGVLTDQEVALARAYEIESPIRSVGCRHCERTGFRGRFPVSEVLYRTQRVQSLIAAGAGSVELEQAAIEEGMRPMLQVALEAARQGQTSLLEVRRVIGEVMTMLESGAVASAAGPDPLGQLLDQAAFRGKFAAEVDASEGCGCGAASLAIIDIDGMSEINRNHGRKTGDEVLLRVSEMIRPLLPEQAVLAHWKGGEFVALVPGMHPPQLAAMLDPLLAKVRACSFAAADGAPFSVTCSIGVADVTGVAVPGEAMARADRFLHRAEALGGDRLISGTPASSLTLGRPAPE